MPKKLFLSSKIEGTQATLGELLADDIGVKANDALDMQEVKNYILALDHGTELFKTLPLSLRLIKGVHHKLMQGVRGEHATPGEFRYTQNWIGSAGCTLNTAKYVPPSPDEMDICLKDFEEYLHNESLPPLIHIALCHYQFEAIHPFIDGNGRVGRLLITLLLLHKKILPSPLLYLSAFFEATRDEYYRRLYNVSGNAAWEEWLIYFLNGVITQAEDVLDRAEKINQLIEKWGHILNDVSSTAYKIIKKCAENPYITINNVSAEFNIAYTTAQRAVLKLERLGILHQTNSNKRDKVYCVKAVLEILEAQTKISQV